MTTDTSVRWAALISAAVAVACGSGPPSEKGADASLSTADTAADSAEGRYAVVVRIAPGLQPRTVAREHGLTPDSVFGGRSPGFTDSLAQTEIDRLREDGRVRSVSIRVEPGDWAPDPGTTVPAM